ncbi:hypothetical protein [Chitinasiproducens palmae]|nr:hypothetical protein [Chitinasiproducens palmae]
MPSVQRVLSTRLLCFLTVLELAALQRRGQFLTAIERASAIRDWLGRQPTEAPPWLDTIRLAERAASLAERLIVSGEAPEDVARLLHNADIDFGSAEVRLLHFRCLIEHYRQIA